MWILPAFAFSHIRTIEAKESETKRSILCALNTLPSCHKRQLCVEFCQIAVTVTITAQRDSVRKQHHASSPKGWSVPNKIMQNSQLISLWLQCICDKNCIGSDLAMCCYPKYLLLLQLQSINMLSTYSLFICALRLQPSEIYCGNRNDSPTATCPSFEICCHSPIQLQ